MDLYFNQEPIRLQTKIQLKNEAKIETLQSFKQNDLVAINNTYKVSKNEHTTTNEDKKNQIYLQIKIHNKHLKNNTVVDNCYIELCLKYEKYS